VGAARWAWRLAREDASRSVEALVWDQEALRSFDAAPWAGH
jgi:hypothetical protein